MGQSFHLFGNRHDFFLNFMTFSDIDKILKFPDLFGQFPNYLTSPDDVANLVQPGHI